jgi:outer membrane protein assembly factor BamB
MTVARSAWAAACVATLAVLVVGCDKDKDAEPPAELVDLKPTLPVKELWSSGVGGGDEVLRVSLVLAYDKGVLYAASHKGKVEALDAASGRTRWTSDTKTPLSAGPAVGNGLVVVGASDGRVTALDAATGAPRWKIQVSGEVLAAPLVAGDRVLLRTVDGRLRSLEAATGKEQWSAEDPVPRLSLRGNAPPVVAGDNVLAGFDSGKVIAYTLATGDIAWQAQVSAPRGRSELERLADVDSAVHVEGGDGYAVGYQGRVVMFALDSGQIWWGRDMSSYRGLALDGDQLYVSTSEGSVTAMRRRDGSVVWQQEGLKRRSLSAPVVIGNAVVVGDFDGYVHWLDRATGRFVARDHQGGARISAQPLVADGRLFVLNEDGKITAYRSGSAQGS